MSDDARRAELLQQLDSIHAEMQQAGMRSQLAARAESVLTPQQIKVAGLLALNGPLRSSELAAVMGVTRSTMTGLLDRLEQGGLIVRRTDPADARSRPADITERGRRALSSLISSLSPRPEQVIELLTIHELECLVTAFKALLRAMRLLDAEAGGTGVSCGLPVAPDLPHAADGRSAGGCDDRGSGGAV
ncbi:MAG: MarR family transcriptional regulator [Bifidobacteriaceae bacterium]|nr:MarR family transcriptional regulator [Bifidobacteriaceae bacterium]